MDRRRLYRGSSSCCVAVGCSLRAKTNALSTIKMIKFPADPYRRKLWEVAVRRKNWTAQKGSALCSKHFITGRTSSDPKHPDYIPSIFAYNHKVEPPKCDKRRKKSKANDFFLWKTELERRTSCKYALQSAPKVLPTNEKIHVYQCDQTLNKKKKFHNIANSKCQAMICATESMKDLEIKVDYWNTHVGHSVQVEQDELNAAINSVQEEQSHGQAMEMLNRIGQAVETDAEVFVTETVDEDMPSTSSSQGIQMNMFNVKKAKSPKVNLPQASPLVPNFSFKKDPSKKKESSIYSLASVACGKVSANKVNINKSASAQFQSLVKFITEKNSGKVKLNSKATKSPESRFRRKEGDSDTTNDSFNNDSNDTDTVPDNSKQTSTSSIHPSSIGGRFIAINPMPQNKSAPTDISPEASIGNSSETLAGKSMSDKENVSLTSNKLSSSLNKSRSLLKSNSKNSENSISSTNGTLGQNLKSLGIVNADAPQIILASVPVPQQNFGSLISDKKSGPAPFSVIAQSSNPASQVVSPMTQTYISIDNKLIPVVNTPGTTLNPNLGSGIILSSALPQLSSGQIAPASLPNLTPSFSASIPGGLFSSNKPMLGKNEKGALQQTQSVSSLTTSFPTAPVVLIPYSNSSTVPSTMQSNPSVSVSSPMVLQTVMPITSLPTKSFASNPLGNLGLTSEKSVSSDIGKSTRRKSTTAANAVKVQKVSLPVTNSTYSPTSNINVVTDAKSVLPQSTSVNPVGLNSTAPVVMNKLTDSISILSQQSLVKSGILNSKPITSTSNINISKSFQSKTHKPGTFVFESSGELFMLEPVDDDQFVKITNPLTSTPIKKSDTPKTVAKSTPTAKRKYSPRGGWAMKSKKLKEDIAKESAEASKLSKSAIYDASTKSAYVVNNEEKVFSDSSDESSNSCVSGISDYSHKDSDTVNNSNSENGENTKKFTSENSVLEKASVNVQKKTSTSVALSPQSPKSKASFPMTSLSENKSKTRHSPFMNLFPTKSSISLLTVKTVPSLAIHQNKPIPSFVSSLRTQSSNLILSSSSPNCISSLQSAGSLVEQTTSQNKNKSVNTCNSELMETTKSDPEKQSETKRGVTIKSVVQEKRCIIDNDLEIMKKVKFYKLEMQYYSCQEECKKLKIELVKALSKNKELTQIIEDLKKNGNCFKENVDVIKNTPSTENCIVDNSSQNVTTDDLSKQTGNEESILETNTIPEMDDIFDKNMSDVSDENSNDQKPDIESITDTVVASDTDDITSDKEMIDVSDESKHDKMKNALITDRIVTSVKDGITSDKEIKHATEKNCEIINTSDDSNDGDNLKIVTIPEDNTISSACERISNEKEFSFSPDSEVVSKESDNSKADVYTMVRTSVLRNLYLDIEDLCREKKKLLEDVEHLKTLQTEFMPSIGK